MIEVWDRGKVFVVGGEPTVTYNPRPEKHLTQRLHDYLEESGRILCVTGPSKTGKTVLVSKTLPDAPRVYGGDIETIEGFWSDVAHELGVFTQESAELGEEKSKDEVSEGGVKAGVAGVGVNAKTSTKTGIQKSKTKTTGREINSKQASKSWLRSNKTAIVIDDFHHIDPTVQRQIVKGIKDLVYAGVPIIVIAVPHRAADVVRAEPEMKGRVDQIKIDSWSDSELSEIATEGFGALNVLCSEEISRSLVEESFGSPHLMQDFCLHICKQAEVKETVPEPSVLELITPLEQFFQTLASADGGGDIVDRIERGARPRKKRVSRKLVNGRETDIYGAVVAAVANTGPQSTVALTEIRDQLSVIVVGETPKRRDYSRVVKLMSKIAENLAYDDERQRFMGDPVMQYDPHSEMLHIVDPFFAFQLRWTKRVAVLER